MEIQPNNQIQKRTTYTGWFNIQRITIGGSQRFFLDTSHTQVVFFPTCLFLMVVRLLRFLKFERCWQTLGTKFVSPYASFQADYPHSTLPSPANQPCASNAPTD